MVWASSKRGILPSPTDPNVRARDARNQIIGTVTRLVSSNGPYRSSPGAIKSNERLAQIVTVGGEVVSSIATETPIGGA